MRILQRATGGGRRAADGGRRTTGDGRGAAGDGRRAGGWRRRSGRICFSLFLLGLGTSCTNDYLTGGELSTDPNRPTAATSAQLFVGIQAGTWALLQSDMARITDMWAQQLLGTN